MKKICFVLTIPFTMNAFLRGHLNRLQWQYDITVFVNLTGSEFEPAVPERVRLVHLNIVRPISPWEDLKALLELLRFFRKERFDLVCSLTPKGGLLSMLAARWVGIPYRIHCFTGQVWANRRGVRRWLLKSLDRVLASCASHLLTDSDSQRKFLVDHGVVEACRIDVLANGSMAGVDLERFRPSESARTAIRSQLGLKREDFCILFLGRLNRDKGVPDLIEAFNRLSTEFAELHLLLVGPDEEEITSTLRGCQRVHWVGYTTVAEDYMAAADLFCLPSYREGFGLVLIEAGAVELPVVASRIYGITDAVIDGETGLLHEPGNISDMVTKLRILISNAALRGVLGKAGRRRAQAEFEERLVQTAFVAYFEHIFNEKLMEHSLSND